MSGPASTHTNSAGFKALGETVEFLERYVSFRRSYDTLDFDIEFRNGGDGMVPGPSEWDVRLVAAVPAEELGAWVAGMKAGTVDRDWLTTVPTSVDVSGVGEWYEGGGRVVGVDRARRVVVYRAWKR